MSFVQRYPHFTYCSSAVRWGGVLLMLNVCISACCYWMFAVGWMQQISLECSCVVIVWTAMLDCLFKLLLIRHFDLSAGCKSRNCFWTKFYPRQQNSFVIGLTFVSCLLSIVISLLFRCLLPARLVNFANCQSSVCMILIDLQLHLWFVALYLKYSVVRVLFWNLSTFCAMMMISVNVSLIVILCSRGYSSWFSDALLMLCIACAYCQSTMFISETNALCCALWSMCIDPIPGPFSNPGTSGLESADPGINPGIGS